MTRMIRAVCALLAVPTLASCGDDGVSPDYFFGHAFALQYTPVIMQSGDAAPMTILSDTLYLNSNPAVRRVTFQVGSTAVMSLTEEYTVELGRARLELHYVCPPYAIALCTEPPHLWGMPSGSGIVLRSQIDPSVSLHYARVPSNLRVQPSRE